MRNLSLENIVAGETFTSGQTYDFIFMVPKMFVYYIPRAHLCYVFEMGEEAREKKRKRTEKGATEWVTQYDKE